MKAKTRLKLIVVLAFSMAAALIGGCTIGLPSYEETLEEKQLTAQVTYYGNGGYFDSSEAILYRLIGYKDGSGFYNIQSSGTSTTVTRGDEWIFNGWYYIQTVQITDDEGEEQDYYVCDDDTVAANFTLTENEGEEDEQKRVVVITYNDQKVISRDDYEMLLRYATTSASLPELKLTGEAVDTSMKLTEGHIYIAASWEKSQGVHYQLLMTDGGTKISYSYTETDEDEKSVTKTADILDGEVIYTNYFGTSTALSVLQSSPVTTLNSSYTMTDGTWLAFFYDEACTQPVSSTATLTKPETGDITIYAMFTTGLWTVIKDSSGVSTLFSSTSRDYYLYNDVDCDGVTVTAMSSFSGSIKGNGHTISNLTVTSTNIGTSNVAMFGTLRSTASITDVTFDNLTVTYTTRAALSGNSYTPYIYLLFAGVASGAKPTFSNVTISNCTMSVTVASGVTVMNIQSESDVDSWLYAIDRGTDETDADFEAAYGGITLDGVALYYNESKIAEISANQ